MCGFAGVTFCCNTVRDNFPFSLDAFRASAERIAHRGDTEHRESIHDLIWLSHYRLAFQDVQSGTQPMVSQDGQHVIVFNGEVYNHLTLRNELKELKHLSFRTRSDTETILEGWKILGNDFFRYFDGEYAFVILKLETGELVAHRDRYGVKPLFFRLPEFNTRLFSIYQQHYTFDLPYLEFSSEIKGITGRKNWQRDGLLRQFTGLYEPVCTPFENVIHLPPGAVLVTRKLNDCFHCELSTRQEPVRYANQTDTASEQSLEHAMREAVGNRLLSDVELGVYLSGGVDSKSIAYELSRMSQHDKPVKSFTVGFEQEGYDETGEALRFAKHMGFDPYVLRIDDRALNYSYPVAVQASELVQPFTNGAAKWWLSLFARQHVQGVLTGDGADEVFCGYPGYRYVNWWRFVMRGRGHAKTVDEVFGLLEKKRLGQSARDDLYRRRFSAHTKNPWLSGSSAEGDGSDFLQSLAMWGVPHPLYGQVSTIAKAVLGQEEGEKWLRAQGDSIRSIYTASLPGIETELANPQHALLLWQNYFALAHLPVLILNWVGDRMEMANTLEGRTPFLSKPLYELMSRQKDTALLRGLHDKVLLRQTYKKLLPADFMATPKKQFNAPFLDSDSLVSTYRTNEIFDSTNIADNSVFENIPVRAKSLENENPHIATHLRTAYQTAISMSIVDYCIADNNQVSRNLELETEYLDRTENII